MNIDQLTEPCLDDIRHLSSAAIAELRSNQAGETGAVYIYEGILAASRSLGLRHFAHEHLQTERIHLAALNQLTPKRFRSKFLPIWRAAGWTLGAFSALVSDDFTYATIRAVETFVVQHYQQQLDMFPTPIRDLLQQFCNDEAEHRDEADRAIDSLSRYPIWERLVGAGSSCAVRLARRF